MSPCRRPVAPTINDGTVEGAAAHVARMEQATNKLFADFNVARDLANDLDEKYSTFPNIRCPYDSHPRFGSTPLQHNVVHWAIILVSGPGHYEVSEKLKKGFPMASMTLSKWPWRRNVIFLNPEQKLRVMRQPANVVSFSRSLLAAHHTTSGTFGPWGAARDSWANQLPGYARALGCPRDPGANQPPGYARGFSGQTTASRVCPGNNSRACDQ